MQSHAVSGMSTRKELAKPFPRCKKQSEKKKTKRKKVWLVVCVCLSMAERGEGVSSLGGREDEEREEKKNSV